MALLEIPDPPEGEGPWKYALVGDDLSKTDDGKVLIKRLEDAGVTVEILTGGGFAMQLQPQMPPDAKIRRAFG